MKILAIETSCDDTGLALIEADKSGNIKILANLVSSQIETHRPWGGVVPNLAKREHEKALPILLNNLTTNYSHSILADIDLIAVTQGPGLAPCLWTGINFATELAQKLNVPIVGINHLKGHIYSALLKPRISNFQFLISKQNPNPKPHTSSSSSSLRLSESNDLRLSEPNGLNPILYPVLALIVSGGHTEIVYSKKLGHYQIIGETKDDAAGEAFDKVAKLIGLGYPGGPEISKRAEKGNPKKFDLPRPMINSKDFDFSFSGLKTAVLYLVKGLYAHSDKKPLQLTAKNIADLCASFEQAVVDVLVSKTLLAAKILKPKALIIGGGVAANKRLRETIRHELGSFAPKLKLMLSDPKLTTDNALMIAMAALAEYKLLKPIKKLSKLEAIPNLRLDQK